MGTPSHHTQEHAAESRARPALRSEGQSSPSSLSLRSRLCQERNYLSSQGDSEVAMETRHAEGGSPVTSFRNLPRVTLGPRARQKPGAGGGLQTAEQEAPTLEQVASDTRGAPEAGMHCVTPRHMQQARTHRVSRERGKEGKCARRFPRGGTGKAGRPAGGLAGCSSVPAFFQKHRV